MGTVVVAAVLPPHRTYLYRVDARNFGNFQPATMSNAWLRNGSNTLLSALRPRQLSAHNFVVLVFSSRLFVSAGM